MIDIARWLESRLKADQYRQQQDDRPMQEASAALLVEAARADHRFTAAERRRLHALLRERFALGDAEAETLLERGAAASAHAVSLTALTQVVNRHCSLEERIRLVGMMWEIAVADGQVDKYEEYVIRQVAGLLHLAHAEFLQARARAIDGN